MLCAWLSNCDTHIDCRSNHIYLTIIAGSMFLSGTIKNGKSQLNRVFIMSPLTSRMVVVVEIFYLQHIICYKKKGSTSKKSLSDHLISILGLSCVGVTASLRDICVSFMIWSAARRSGGRPLGRRLDEGGVEARNSMAWCRVADGMCPKAPSRSLRIVVGLSGAGAH